MSEPEWLTGFLHAVYPEMTDLAVATAHTEKQLLTDATTVILAARAEIEEWEEREAACCPEDVGFPEYIKTLTAARENAERELAEANTERDGLWCRALVYTLQPQEIERVTAKFNAIRALDAGEKKP